MKDLTPEDPEAAYYDCVWRRIGGVVMDMMPPIEPFECVRCGETRGGQDFGHGYQFEPRICPAFTREVHRP